MAVDVERKVEQSWRQLYQVMQTKGDISGCELIEHEFLQNQVGVIDLLVSYYNGLHHSKCPFTYDRENIREMCKEIRTQVGHSKIQSYFMNEND